MNHVVERHRHPSWRIQAAALADRIRREFARTPDDPDLRWAMAELEKAEAERRPPRCALPAPVRLSRAGPRAGIGRRR